MNDDWASKPINPFFSRLVEYYITTPLLTMTLGFIDSVVETLNPTTRLFKVVKPGDLVEIIYTDQGPSSQPHKMLQTITQNVGFKLYRNFPTHGMVIDTEIKSFPPYMPPAHPRREFRAHILINGACVILSDVDFYHGVYVRKIQNARW